MKINSHFVITAALLCSALSFSSCNGNTKEPDNNSNKPSDNTDHDIKPDNTDENSDDDSDPTACVLDEEEIQIDPNAVCKGPNSEEDLLMADGYYCFTDKNCKSKKCSTATFTCGGKLVDGWECSNNEDCLSGNCNTTTKTCGGAEKISAFKNLPLFSTCVNDSECQSGVCYWTETEGRCAQKCQEGDSGDGNYYCAQGLFTYVNTGYFCQPDPKVGKKCCKDSDCGGSSICFNRHCSTDCSSNDQVNYTCPTNSKCYKFWTPSINDYLNLCIADKLIGELEPGDHCINDVFCKSGHCNYDKKCSNLDNVSCSGPASYPKFEQPAGYPCNIDQDCQSGICSITDNAFVCVDKIDDEPIFKEVRDLPNNAPCQNDYECQSGYCWYNGGEQFAAQGISDASYCAQPCIDGVAGSDGNFACQKNNFDKFICSPVRKNKGEKGDNCQITEFDCNENLTCSRVNHVCKGL